MVIREKGFTLIEVLLIFMILGFILSIVSPSFNNSINLVEELRLQSDIKRIEDAIQLYYLDNKVYPQIIKDLWDRPLDGDLESKWKGPYINSNTLLLSENEYLIGTRGRVSVISY